MPKKSIQAESRAPLGSHEEPLLREIGVLSSRVTLSESRLRRLFSAYAKLRVGSLYAERFRLLELDFLGEKTVLYRGFDEKTGRAVAVKLVQAPPHLIAQPKHAHPNVVEIFECTEGDDGCHVEILEYLEGCTVRQLLDEHGRLPVAQSLAILAEAARGLAHLHSSRLLHRDLKPENLFLTAQPDRPLSLKIIDLGLAIPFRSSVLDEIAIAGTPGYVAPERLRRQSYDEASDVYSLGIILHEMLSVSVEESSDRFGLRDEDREFLDVLRTSMLAEFPSERPSARQIVRLIELHLPKTLGSLPSPRASAHPPKAGKETLPSIERTPLSEVRPPRSKGS